MDKETRNLIFNTTQAVRRLLEEEFALQLEGTFDIHRDGRMAEKPGAQLTPAEKLVRQRIVDAIRHRQAAGQSTLESVRGFLSEAVFTFLNRLAALKMMEARGLVLPCVSEGDQSRGFKEFSGLAPGLIELPDKGYRLYLECLFDEIGREVGALFDRTDAASQLWPRRKALEAALEKLNTPELSGVWVEDETIGWIYQYFNDEAERKQMREESAAPRNSRELAVRNQFFTPRYVVEFLTDNTLGRIWFEMTQGKTRLKEQCKYLVRRPDEVFLGALTQSGVEYESEGCITTAQRLQSGKDSDFAAYHADRVQEVIDLAHTVNGYYRLPETEALWGGWYEAEVGAASRGEWLTRSTQEILDFMFIVCRNDRATQGDTAGHPWFIDLANEVRRRALHSRQENLPQEELLKQPVFVPFRPIKDPRTILMLDPACGSMHFGLYAFDLFLAIYEEAWALEENDRFRIERPANLKSLHDSYVDKRAFLLDVPRLVIEHNIHGIDIDPRAAQIAKLSLWLRAQRAWHQSSVKPTERPAITKSNIVCAEPMPGEKELLQEFVNQQFPAVERPAFSFLLGKIFDHMKLAGEAGSLLRIEEEIRSAIAEARTMAQHQATPKQAQLFPGDEPREQVEFDLRGLNDEQFWEAAEQRIYDALEAYANQRENSGGFQRRLFADDAAQGFAFIDLCRKRYDLVLMNPPFGLSQGKLYEYLNSNYPDAFIDLLAAFIVRGRELAPSGFLGAITSRACLYTKTLLDWRTRNLSGRISELADLGLGVLDGAMVEACAYVIPGAEAASEGTFFDAKKSNTKGSDLAAAICHFTTGRLASLSTFVRSAKFFALVPEHRILYALPEEFWARVISLPRIEPKKGTVRAGLTTYDDVRFLRLRWEIPNSEIDVKKTWMLISKGGAFSTFYNDIHLVVLWAKTGQEVGAYNTIHYGTDAQSRRGSSFYCRPAATYSRRTHSFSARSLPENCFFSDKGPAILPLGDVSPKYILGLFNSDLFRGLIHIQSQFGCFETGILKLLPWAQPTIEAAKAVESLTHDCWSAKAKFFRGDETDALFTSPIRDAHSTLLSLAAGGKVIAAKANETARQSANEISQRVALIFGLSTDGFQDLDVDPGDHAIKETSEVLESDEHFGKTIASYLLGIVFGRWDIRLATGQRPVPPEPDPFAPLPVCPPGMLQNAERLPATLNDVSADYPVHIIWTGIIVDDKGHADDIETQVCAVLSLLWPGAVDSIAEEACGLLGVKSLRDWFRKPGNFFADHLKRYSKSRRQAPIYWQLSSPNSLYTVWLYYHRLTPDTLFTVLRDHVKPKLEFEERRAFALRQDAGPSPSPSQRRDLAEAEELVEDLRAFRAELERVAPLFRPDLNDGVIINHAPLWRMIGLPKWRNDCQSVWDDLVKGEYDWAHLALHLWPERVIPKCAEDRSLAIAHGFDEVFWQEDPSKPGKWTSKKVSATEMQKLVSDRTSAAVKSALDALIQAGGSKSSSGRKGKRGE